jgi:probable F420-dependent oxidoreductase
MRYGLCLPNFTDLASAEAIEATADAAERLAFETVWTTDHVLIDHRSAGREYHVNFDAIETLAWVGSRHPSLKLGTSVLVVPQRNAVVLAKELASLDALSRGRVIAGVGIGWNEVEFANLGMEDRFHVRGAYLDETIALWRHLWSGSAEPFHGRFHAMDDFVFAPLPAQGAALPIVVGGRAEAALRRAGRLGDGYHSSATGPSALAPRLPIIRAAAEQAGRPAPALSARVRVAFDEPARSSSARSYAIRGDAAEMAAEVRAFAGLGVDHLALFFEADSAAGIIAAAERFATEVMAAP